MTTIGDDHDDGMVFVPTATDETGALTDWVWLPKAEAQYWDARLWNSGDPRV